MNINKLADEIIMLADFVENLKLENARYRKALQVYADDDVIGTVARKALKGE